MNKSFNYKNTFKIPYSLNYKNLSKYICKDNIIQQKLLNCKIFLKFLKIFKNFKTFLLIFNINYFIISLTIIHIKIVKK